MKTFSEKNRKKNKMTRQLTITGHNPSGYTINEGWYALAAAIICGLNPDEAILRILGFRPNCETSMLRNRRAKRGAIKDKIIALYNENNNLKPKQIANELDCSEEMVKYALKSLQHKKRTKATERMETKKEQVFTILREQPFKTTKEIAKELNISYSTANNYVNEYYTAIQMELPF